jgi:hypothetical protein
MRIKPGVVLDGMHPLIWTAAGYLDWLRQSHGLGAATISGGREAPDAGPATAARRAGTDAHARGEAIDLRTNDLPGGSRGAAARELAQAMQDALGGDFRVVLEQDHLHVVIIAL